MRKIKTKIVIFVVLFIAIITMLYTVQAATYTPAKLRIMIDELDSVVQQLSDAGLGTQRIEDLIDEANKAYLNQEFDMITSLIDQAYDMRDLALDLHNQTSEFETKLILAKAQSIDTSEVREVTKELDIEMRLENYAQAEILLQQAEDKLSEKVKEEYQSYSSNSVSISEAASELGLDVARINQLSTLLDNYIQEGDVENIINVITELDMIESAVNSIENVKIIISDFGDEEIKTQRFQDILDESKFHFDKSNFEEVIILGDDASRLYELALDSKQLIGMLSGEIGVARNENPNIDLFDSEILFEEGKAEYELENYESSKQLLDQSLAKLEQAESDALLFGAINTNHARVRFVNFMRSYWWLVLISLAIFVFGGRKVYFKVQKNYIDKKIHDFEQELIFLRQEIKKKQVEYYNKKLISKSEYDLAIDEHQERMLIIREKIPVLKAKLNKQ